MAFEFCIDGKELKLQRFNFTLSISGTTGRDSSHYLYLVKAQAKMYWFPSMERHEIIEAFNEWSIPVSQHNLENPTSEFVTLIYSACLQRVRSISEAELEQPLQVALAQTDNAVRGPHLSHIAYLHRDYRTCTPLRSRTACYSIICMWSIKFRPQKLTL